eukprot:sb/3477609/
MVVVPSGYEVGELANKHFFDSLCVRHKLGVSAQNEKSDSPAPENKAEILMDNFDYGDDDEDAVNRQLKKVKAANPPSAEKYNPNKSAESRELDKLYTPSPIEKPPKK